MTELEASEDVAFLDERVALAAALAEKQRAAANALADRLGIRDPRLLFQAIVSNMSLRPLDMVAPRVGSGRPTGSSLDA